MERSQYDLLEVLDHIEPAELDYQQWLNIGMALDLEGYSVDVWDNWSRRDPGRYHPGECQKKWKGFKGNGSPVTGGTIVQYAREQGWTPPYDPGHALGWEDTISSEEGVFIDRNWVEGKEVREPARFDPAKELIRYLETLFEAGENVGYVVKSWQKDDKWLPADKGSFDRTAGQLIEALSACGGDTGILLGSKIKDGDRVMIIEDVTTSGKSIEETFPIIKAQGDVEIKGLIVSLNRMERGKGTKSALDEIKDLYGFPTAAIVTMADVTECLYNKECNGQVVIDDKIKTALDAYYEQYGAKNE